ncbi:MAG: glucose 1-dehydrogenase [Deltaproteobacteria bacterium]|nr:glucose 1-dehydrogenase [Deltaproteobacteria bacterium]
MTGKVALITGSSRGIGKAIALELASRNSDIVVNYFRKRQAAKATVQEIEAHGVRVISIRAHMGKPDQINALFEEVTKTFGGIDILVCNAASGVFRNTMEISQREWNWTVSINTESVLLCSQQAVPLMEDRGGGRIINVSSLFSLRMLPYYAATGVSKGAMEILTRYLAVELAPKGIIVNAVAPGAVVTEEWKLYPNRDETLRRILQRTPTGRHVTPEDVAKVVAFLCSNDAEEIVGQTIIVDGGFSLTW